MDSKIEQPNIRVGMLQKDRQNINLMIAHKVAEFKALIEKSVVALLNAQEELSQLSDVRTARSNLLTNRYKQQKEQLSGVVDGLKEATTSAPMGIGNAAHLTLEASKAVGSTILDSKELQRQIAEKDAELYAAQMRYYISAADFEYIAKRVADILAYRYQFLIFRLAGGEEGYIKLGHFFINSMKSYAISCLREQKHNIVKALIHAAIPPITDELKYRNWSIFGSLKLKTLRLDEESTDIVKRCGPAVRTFLGGFDVYIDYDTGKAHKYKEYTIFSALNRAPILSTEKTVIAGLASPHRKYITLDGNTKYPTVLLAVNEAPADLGLKFGTNILTKEILEPQHIEVLNRLVPDFFCRRAEYQIDHSFNQDVMEQPNPAALRYPEEKKEYSWTPERQRMFIERTQHILIADLKSEATVAGEEEATKRALVMHHAANVHDLALKKKEAIQIEQEAVKLIQTLFAEPLDTESRKYKQLEIVSHAEYVAFAAHQLLICMSRFERYEECDLSLVKQIIETIHLAIHASRAHPIKETSDYQQALSCLETMEQNAAIIFEFQDFCDKNFEIALDAMSKIKPDAQKDRFIVREELAKSKEKQSLINQITKMIKESQIIASMSRTIAVYHDNHKAEPLQISDVLHSFQAEMSAVRANIVSVDERAHKSEMIEVIRLCKEEVTQYVKHIQILLENDHVTSRYRDLFASEQSEDNQPSKEELIRTIKRLHLDAETTFEEAERLRSISYFLHNQKPAIFQLKETAVNLRDQCIAILDSLVYHVEPSMSSPTHQKVSHFFERASISTSFSMLHYIISLRSKTKEIDLTELYNQARLLHAAYVSGHATQAETANKEISTSISSLQSSDLYELRNQHRQIRKQIKQLKLKIRDDIELVGLIYDDALVIAREVDNAQQAIENIKDKLKFLKENNPCNSTAEDEEKELIESMAHSSSEPASGALDLNDSGIMVSQRVTPGSFRNESREPVIDSAHAFAPTERYIKEKLDQLVKNISTTYHEINDLHIQKLYDKIEKMKSKKKSDLSGSYEYFIFDMINNFILTVSSIVYASDPLLQINQNKKIIADIVNGESFEYQCALEKAMRELRLVYRLMADVALQKEKVTRAKGFQNVSLCRSVPGTLIWAGTPSVFEKKCLDDKGIAETKKHLSFVEAYKSPIRMFYSLILVVVTERLCNKQEELKALKKRKHQLLKMKSQLCLTEAVTIEEQEFPHQQTRQRLYELVVESITTIEAEITDLIQLQRSMVKQAIKIYFTEWRVKTQHSEIKPYLHKMKRLFSESLISLDFKSDDLDKPHSDGGSQSILSVVDNYTNGLRQSDNTPLLRPAVFSPSGTPN